MIDIASIFKNRKCDYDKLIAYGFSRSDQAFVKNFQIMDGQFAAEISVSEGGAADLRVYDAETQDEYVLAHVYNASGAFVGEIHKECENILSDISSKCFYTDCFRSEQTKRILRFIKEKYDVDPEFLWSRFPEWAALRVHGKKPWFAVIGRVQKEKLGMNEEGTAEFIVLKDEPEAVAARISSGSALLAYHMNKKHWYSLVMDGSSPDEEILLCVDKSYNIAG